MTEKWEIWERMGRHPFITPILSHDSHKFEFLISNFEFSIL